MKNLFLILVALLFANYSYSQTLHHKLIVDIDIQSNTIDVIDNIIIPVELLNNSDEAVFYLNNNLKLKSLSKQIKIVRFDNEDSDSSRAVTLAKYSIQVPSTDKKLLKIPVQYSGIIKHEIVEGAVEYARGFSETSGIIFDKGVYLAGSTYWVPRFEASEMSSFELTVKIDEDWAVVSQGKRVRNELVGNKMTIKYESPEPMDEIYLIAAKWTEYSEQFENVLVQAFLRTPDEALAQRYIKVTADYIRLYQDLLGDYPYTKFALVENFWETGYGMPSFTLLGEKVIRFPWILHSSYPHELLHNYWGNSVFVDYETGNWCEGITVYMADHLIKEKQGIAGDYRRNTLQKYTDYVNLENDFPVAEFLSRNNSAEEAIGYGKSMMFNEMLRYKFGDEVFKKSYRKFYEENKYRKASFNDIQKCFEEVSGEDLQAFFKQWIGRTGAPTLELSEVSVKEKKGKYISRIKLSQTQNEDVFDLLVPVVLYCEGETEVQLENINFNKREEFFTLTSDKKPLKIEIDPQFNIFRRLDRNEVPTSLSQVMGSKNGIVILPGKSSNLKEYEDLGKMWSQIQKAQGNTLKIVYDTDIESIPGDKPAWIFGFENKFAEKVQISDEYNDHFSEDVMVNFNTARKSGSLVYTLSNPNNKEFTLGFLATNNPVALKSLATKLMHYGKYGYLAFEGDDATNTLKGMFPVINSPLSYKLKYKGSAPKVEAKIIPRKALAY
ncbi:MAG: hypothetical protein HN352_17425 [Bacteroidetes bacterium]|jgi:aminopeptidase N|nr:hypothetical protein [Bacteroidota bacterium]MBT4400935.1 hypothetical protein [Bacteroidota bacterium]MBT7093867.1 hypothetical protein [Bacteroidota bacterium]MBT7464275.1 hypothetical protein [Bacteroidota bacterium]